MFIDYIKDDIFNAPVNFAKAHCISYDCAMGVGIAKEFTKRYPLMKNHIQSTITKFNSYPIIIPYKEGNDIIFNLVTKLNYWDKPTYKSIEICLTYLRDICVKNGILYLAMPCIASGYDKKDWNKIDSLIKEIFKETYISIVIYQKEK